MTTALILRQPSPSIFQDVSSIQRADLGTGTKNQYIRAIERMNQSGINPFNEKQYLAYVDSLLSSNASFLHAAVACVTAGLIHSLKANALPETIDSTQAALLRLEAVNDSIVIKKTVTKQTHTWLSQEQITKMLSFCGNDLEGQRDRVILSTMLGTGVRRDEMTKLTFADIEARPISKGYRALVIVREGKGKKYREIPIKDDLAKTLMEWKAFTGGGKIARAVTGGRKRKDGKIVPKRLLKSISGAGIRDICNRYGVLIGIPVFNAHSLRRTFAEFAYNQKGIMETSRLLGHASVSTTQTYLKKTVDMETTASDFMDLR